ncbi:hypothetical protein K438DRAFT_1821322 [Mycena galopus ATCC 62051]|nr:hypothetical protein K438DRAFT_1821322 [Mycena galopus ATCC 62051]
MRPRSTPSPKGSAHSHNDAATYRDILLFEERLKTTAASLQRRKSRYQLFLFQLLLIIAFLLAEVLLPSNISLFEMTLRRVLPQDTKVHVHPHISIGLLFVSVTTLVLFFASGTYSDKIAYANKYVPHANRALRTFNMHLNVRPPPLRSKLSVNPLSFFNPRPPAEETSTRPSSPAKTRSFPSATLQPTTTTTSVPIPPMPPTTNPRGELRFSSRVDRAFREGYERYRASFERKRQQKQLEREHGRGWFGLGIVRTLNWGRDAPATGVSGFSVARSSARSGTPPSSAPWEKGKGTEGSGSTVVRRQRSSALDRSSTVH